MSRDLGWGLIRSTAKSRAKRVANRIIKGRNELEKRLFEKMRINIKNYDDLAKNFKKKNPEKKLFERMRDKEKRRLKDYVMLYHEYSINPKVIIGIDKALRIKDGTVRGIVRLSRRRRNNVALAKDEDDYFKVRVVPPKNKFGMRRSTLVKRLQGFQRRLRGHIKQQMEKGASIGDVEDKIRSKIVKFEGLEKKALRQGKEVIARWNRRRAEIADEELYRYRNRFRR